MAIAAANLVFRIDREMVDVWDESLYATTALEMVASGDWLVTTFQGAIDHYNTKPPLNVWLVSAAFSVFGVNLVALRATSVVAAWLTVLLVWWWSRKTAGAVVAVLAALVLGTTYPFLYVHAGRTANPDALLTLLLTGAAVLAWAPGAGPRAFWLGPMAGAAFMLKGPAAVLPFGLLAAADLWSARREAAGRSRWWAPRLAGAAAGAVVPLWWAVARWQFDGPLFLSRMVGYDLVARASAALEGHEEPFWFYATALARYDYEWLVVAGVALALAPGMLRTARAWWAEAPGARPQLTFAAWLVATVIVPTAVPTKVAWYLNPFYPGFAVLVALAIVHTWRASAGNWRRPCLAVLVVVAVVAAETRLWLRSERLDLSRSAQGLLLDHASDIRGHRVFASRCPRPEWFLAAAAGARCTVAPDISAFVARSAAGDYWLDGHDVAPPGLVLVDRNRRAAIFRRPADITGSR